MKLELNDNLKIQTALTLVYDRKFYRALELFTQVNSYESLVNQIVCLCIMDETAYAMDLYRQTKSSLGGEYALYSDIASYGITTRALLEVCESNKKYAKKIDGARRADRTLLIKMNRLCEEEDIIEDSAYDGWDDFELFDGKAVGRRFFEANSEEYFDYLRYQMGRWYFEGEEKKAEKYAKMLLEVETNHLPTLEAQIAIVLYMEKYKKGIAYAKRLSEVEGGAAAAISGAIEILMRTDPRKNLDVLKKLMCKAVDIADEISLFDLEDFIYIATSYVCDMEMSRKFAVKLFAEGDNASIDGLKLCAVAFYNFGDTELAKQAVVTISRIAPWDVWGKLFADFLIKNPYSKNQFPIDLPPRILRHFYLPEKLASYAMAQLDGQFKADAEQIFFDDKQLVYFSALINHCKVLMLTGHRKEYSQCVAVVRGLLDKCVCKDLQTLFDFIKTQLCQALSDQTLNACFITFLAQRGCKDKVLVGLMTSCYILDLSTVESDDETFLTAFGICTALVDVEDPRKLFASYKKFTDFLNDYKTEGSLTHELAYAMLCFSIRNFEQTNAAEFFPETDKALLIKYLETGDRD